MNNVFRIAFRCMQYFLYWLSGAFPRNKNIWVFGCFGIYGDNSRYLYEHVCKNNPDITPVWISQNIQSVELASKYGKSYRRYSVMGLYFCLRAGVYIYSSYARDICWFTSRGALNVNLWHGIPLKKIEFDIRCLPLVKIFHEANILSKFMHPHAHLRHDLVLCPSLYVAEYSYISAFRLRGIENLIITSYPRIGQILKMAKNRSVDADKSPFTFVYTPTWRDSGVDFIAESGINFELLNDFLAKNNARLKIKLHPATELTINPIGWSNISLIDNKIDPCELIVMADCLITDYSSIFFDFLILDRPIIFFPFDKENYLKERELYLDYDLNTPGVKVYSLSELIAAMEKIISNSDDHQTERNDMKALFGIDYNKGNETIVSSIKKNLFDF